MFWSRVDGGLVVLDFNLSFDNDLVFNDFWETHAFREASATWSPAFRIVAEAKMNAALARLPEFWQELPADWRHLDGDTSLPEILSRDEVESTLNRFLTDPESFWTSHP